MKKIITFLVLTLSLPAMAGYEIRWHTIDGGGGFSSGGDYKLTGTIGQYDAAYSYGDDYELLGGFWSGGPLCFVDFEDFARFANQWLYVGSEFEADLSGNDEIDTEDLGLFITEWLYPCPYGWPLK